MVHLSMMDGICMYGMRMFRKREVPLKLMFEPSTHVEAEVDVEAQMRCNT